MIVYDAKRRTKMYTINHHIHKKRPVYCGQTVDEAGRKSTYHSHALRDRTVTNVKRNIEARRKTNPLIVEYVRYLLHKKESLVLEVCPWFPNGVPHERADGFEALMIHDLETGANEKHGYGKNTSLGNNLAEHLPRFDEYRAELNASGGVYVWSEEDEMRSRGMMPIPVAPEVMEAETKASALLDVRDMIIEAAPDVATEPLEPLDEQIRGALIVVEDTKRRCLGPLALAEHLSAKYAEPLGVSTADSGEFQLDLNALMAKLEEAPTPDKDLLGLCRATHLMAKRQLTAGFVSSQFAALARSIEASEEAALPDCPEVALMKEARSIMMQTDVPRLRAAKAADVSPRENELHAEIVALVNKDPKAIDAASMRFVLRSNAEWLRWFDIHISPWAAGVTTRAINEMLLQGYAHRDEPPFEGRKKWPCGLSKSPAHRIYNGMMGLRRAVTGVLRPKGEKHASVSQSKLDAALKGLKDKWPARDAWWRTAPVKAEAEAEAGASDSTQPTEAAPAESDSDDWFSDGQE